MDVTIEREGLAFTFEGWCYPLEAYTAGARGGRAAIEAMREPADPAAALGECADVLMWRCVKAR